jgi:hypothetical protein
MPVLHRHVVARSHLHKRTFPQALRYVESIAQGLSERHASPALKGRGLLAERDKAAQQSDSCTVAMGERQLGPSRESVAIGRQTLLLIYNDDITARMLPG